MAAARKLLTWAWIIFPDEPAGIQISMPILLDKFERIWARAHSAKYHFYLIPLRESKAPMSDLFHEVVQFFTDDGWRFEQVRDLPILQMGFKTDEQAWLCYAQVNEEEKCFLFYSIYPQDIPREMRPAVAEYITRVNFGLFIGNFELDYGDGEVRYKTSIAATAGQPDRDLLRNTVHANLGAMERYMPGLDQVLNEDQSPAEVLRWIDVD